MLVEYRYIVYYNADIVGNADIVANSNCVFNISTEGLSINNVRKRLKKTPKKIAFRHTASPTVLLDKKYSAHTDLFPGLLIWPLLL